VQKTLDVLCLKFELEGPLERLVMTRRGLTIGADAGIPSSVFTATGIDEKSDDMSDGPVNGEKYAP
jgi:hypothetical protein